MGYIEYPPHKFDCGIPEGNWSQQTTDNFARICAARERAFNALYWPDRAVYIIILLFPPLVLLAIGSLVGWVMSGFSRTEHRARKR